jgi:hypothetical protein
VSQRENKRPPSTWVLEHPASGIGQVRAIEHRELGTRKAEAIHDALCTACYTPIGTEPFVEVNGEPKHERHLRGL